MPQAINHKNRGNIPIIIIQQPLDSMYRGTLNTNSPRTQKRPIMFFYRTLHQSKNYFREVGFSDNHQGTSHLDYEQMYLAKTSVGEQAATH